VAAVLLGCRPPEGAILELELILGKPPGPRAVVTSGGGGEGCMGRTLG